MKNSNFWSSCLYLPRTRITCVYLHAQFMRCGGGGWGGTPGVHNEQAFYRLSYIPIPVPCYSLAPNPVPGTWEASKGKGHLEREVG